MINTQNELIVVRFLEAYGIASGTGPRAQASDWLVLASSAAGLCWFPENHVSVQTCLHQLLGSPLESTYLLFWTMWALPSPTCDPAMLPEAWILGLYHYVYLHHAKKNPTNAPPIILLGPLIRRMITALSRYHNYRYLNGSTSGSYISSECFLGKKPEIFITVSLGSLGSFIPWRTITGPVTTTPASMRRESGLLSRSIWPITFKLSTPLQRPWAKSCLTTTKDPKSSSGYPCAYAAKASREFCCRKGSARQDRLVQEGCFARSKSKRIWEIRRLDGRR